MIFLAKIWIIGFLLLHFVIYLSVRKSKQKDDPIFEKILVHYPLIKIKKNLFYFKGVYITPTDFIFTTHKLTHYNSITFIFNVLRIVKIK